MWISEDNNSFNFVAPEGASNQVNEVNFPLMENETVVAAATIPITAKFAENIKNIGVLVGDTAIDVTLDAQLRDGAKLHLQVTDSGAGDTVSFGTNMQGKAQTLTAGKSYLISFILISGVFVLQSASLLD